MIKEANQEINNDNYEEIIQENNSIDESEIEEIAEYSSDDIQEIDTNEENVVVESIAENNQNDLQINHMKDMQYLKMFIEAALLASDHPLTIDQIKQLIDENERPETQEIREALTQLAADCENRGIELAEVASGFRYQIKIQFGSRIGKLWQEKPPRYSRALLETLALIAYRQPITRAEIEDIRGVVVSTHIIKILLEREWVRVVGHRDVPGKPALYATTRQFLDYFNMKSLSELPTLTEIQNLDHLAEQLEVQGNSAVVQIALENQSEQIEGNAETINDEITDEVEDVEQDIDSDSEIIVEEIIVVEQDFAEEKVVEHEEP
jgi:segregation and condensation protein B